MKTEEGEREEIQEEGCFQQKWFRIFDVSLVLFFFFLLVFPTSWCRVSGWLLTSLALLLYLTSASKGV